MSTNTFEEEFKTKVLWVYGSAIAIFMFRFISEAMFTQMSAPSLVSRETECFYQIFFASGIVQIISGSTIYSILADISLLIVPLLLMLSFQRALAIFFSIITLIYFFSFNIITGHHYHGLVGLLVISVPFWFKNEIKFRLAWEGARYYLLYIFASAALWKISRGSVFHPEQLSAILSSQQLDYLLQNSGTLKARALSYLIAHPSFSHYLLLLNTMLQLSFVVGFFTKRFDFVLVILAVAFTLFNYVVMGIWSFELLILCIPLLNRIKLTLDAGVKTDLKK